MLKLSSSSAARYALRASSVRSYFSDSSMAARSTSLLIVSAVLDRFIISTTTPPALARPDITLRNVWLPARALILASAPAFWSEDRTSVVWGKSVAGRVDLGGG